MASDTKTDLLNSAERAARMRGFDGFSYADLALDVGIRKASIHHHFPTKAALSEALMLRYYDNLQSACADINASNSTGGARLAALIDRYTLALDGGQSICLCVAFSVSPESLPQSVIVQIREFRVMMIDWLAEVFTTAKSDNTISNVLDPRSEAAATLSLLEGAQLAARAQQNPDLFAAATRLLTDRLV